jgi:ATP-binding cassette subfamily G (WHITE) protein 2 (SNQ2)
MPSFIFPPRAFSRQEPPAAEPDNQDPEAQVHADDEAEDTLAHLQQILTGYNDDKDAGAFPGFEDYLRNNEEAAPQYVPLSVCFKGLTTYGIQAEDSNVKTLKDAILRTLSCKEIYEATLKRLIKPVKVDNGRPLIRDFTGVVRNGEMML